MTCPYSVKTAETRPADKGKGQRSFGPCDKGDPGPDPGPGSGLWAPVWSKNKVLVPSLDPPLKLSWGLGGLV